MVKKISVFFSFFENQIFLLLGSIIALFYFIFRLILPVKSGSHPISKFFRSIFEQQKARTSWSLVLPLIILLINFLHMPNNYKAERQPNLVLAAPENVVGTEPGFQLPVNGQISQGFHWYHQALDLEAPLGSKVYPITEGTVETSQYTSFGYGHFIIISHGLNERSLYAHLGLIKVKAGDKVDKNTVLGYVGLTGWTTGPHLHLEIFEDGKNINPQEVLPDFPSQIVSN